MSRPPSPQQEYRKVKRARDTLYEILETVLDRFIGRDVGEEWTDQDVLFVQDVRDLYEEVGDG